VVAALTSGAAAGDRVARVELQPDVLWRDDVALDGVAR
jgi:hypothetical protein